MDNLENRTPNFNEVTTIDNGRDVTRGYYLQPLLTYADKILQMRGGHDLEIYEELLRDDQCSTALLQRRNKILSWEWHVEPGKRRFMAATEQDERAADFLREILSSIPFDDITGKMHYGFWYGYQVGEIMYARDDKYIVLDDLRNGIKVKKSRRFRFDKEMKLRLITQGDRWVGEALDPMKFWHFSAGADNDDDPYGLGLAHYCYWPVTIKRDGIVAWMAFLKRFGIPFTLGKYQPGATLEEQNKLLSVVAGVSSDSGGIVPDGMVLELIEASRGGTADYEAVYQRMDKAIAKVILGETMTLEAEGGQYKGDIHENIQDSICAADADLLSQSFGNKVAAPLMFYNRAHFGEDVAVPCVWRRPPEDEDVERTAKIYVDLRTAGFEPESVDQVNDTFGGQWRRIEGDRPSPLLSSAEFAESELPADQRELDTYLAEISDSELQGQLEPVIEPLLERLLSGDGDGALEQLGEIYPEMDSSALEAILERVFFISEVWGRINAERG